MGPFNFELIPVWMIVIICVEEKFNVGFDSNQIRNSYDFYVDPIN